MFKSGGIQHLLRIISIWFCYGYADLKLSFFLIYFHLSNTKTPTFPTLCIHEKLDRYWWHSFMQCALQFSQSRQCLCSFLLFIHIVSFICTPWGYPLPQTMSVIQKSHPMRRRDVAEMSAITVSECTSRPRHPCRTVNCVGNALIAAAVPLD